MKKLLVSALAIVGLVACSQEQTLVSKSPASMEFGVASLDKATRVDPSLTTDNLTGFNVWAWMDDESGNVLTKENVEKVGGEWRYFNTAYWLPGHNYSFVAIAPMNSANWKYNLNGADNGENNTIDFKNVDGTEDLIYAVAERSTVGDAVGKDYEAVELRFKHLLSKTKFTFKNGFATDNVTVQVTDVKMTAFAEATYAGGKWGEATGATAEPLAYGNTAVMEAGKPSVVADERLIIPAPATASYEITYTVQVWYGEKPGFENGLTKTTTLTGWEFEQGKAYNFVAEITPESLNLDEIEFTVVVNEWDKQDVNVGQIQDEVKFVYTIDELQAALNAAGDTTVVLGADLAGNVTVPELKNATIAIYGNGKKFDGCFFIDGKSSYDKGTTIFDGVNFVTSDNSTLVGDAFIYCGEAKGTSYRYPDNVIVKDCTFTAEGSAVDAAVGIKFWSLNGNLVVENSKAEGMHSLMQLTSCGTATVLVDGVEVVNCKNGLSLQFSDNTIRNSKIVAREYGVRANGNDGATSIVKSTIEAKQPVIVRKTTAAGYTVNVDEASVLKTAEAYHVIFTQGNDDAEYVAPEVDFTFNGPADLLVFPYVIVADNAETLAATLTANKKNINVVLADNIDLPINTLGQQTGGSGEYKLGGEATEAITIDLNGKKLNVTTTYWSVLGAKNADALFTIKNGTMTSSQTTGTWNSYDLCFANCNYNFEDVAFEKAIALEAANKTYNLKNVSIAETHDYYAMWVSAKGQTVNIDGLTIESAGRGVKIDEQYVSAPAKVTMNVANATFNTVKKAAIVVKSVAGAEINVENIDIANVAADNSFAVWVDENSAAYADKVVVNGALVKVEGSADAVVATTEALKTAIDNGAKSVYLTEGTYSLPTLSGKEGVVIIGTEGTVIGGDNASTGFGSNFGKNTTIKNVTFSGTTNGVRWSYAQGGETVFENCTFAGGSTYGFHIDESKGATFTFNNCVFSGFNAFAGDLVSITFNDCTFEHNGNYGHTNIWSVAYFNNCAWGAGASVSGNKLYFNGVEESWKHEF